MANQLKMADQQAIIALAGHGWSYRRIADELGVHRETVARYVKLSQETAEPDVPPPESDSKPAIPIAGPAAAKPAKVITGSGGLAGAESAQVMAGEASSRSRCEPFRAIIIESLERGLSAQRIWQDLQSEHGFADSYQSVQRFVRHLRSATPLPFRRMECEPGEEAQIDFGTGAPVITPDTQASTTSAPHAQASTRGVKGRRRRTHVFRIVLSHSRKGYSESVFRQTTEEFIRCIENAFQHFGGVPKTLVIDNLKAAVTKADWYDPDLNPKIQAFCEHYGTVIDDLDPNTTYTEGGMNEGISGREIPKKFETEEYRVLIAADKFQTGFDQPLLHTMYVDKRLAGIQAVQTLSRLNRTHPGKEDTFVLDFYNDREEILRAFQDYYEVTTVGEEADPQQLYTLQAELNGSGVYHGDEVEAFCAVFFAKRARQSPSDHAKMNAILDVAVDRFRTMRDELRAQVTEEEWRRAKEEAQEEFRSRLKAFRALYSFLSQVIPYQDTDLEKLYTYARFLVTKLPRPDTGPHYHFEDEVALKFYRLQKISEGAIELQTGVGGQLKGPTAVGTGKAHDEEVELSRLIDLLNERFGTDFKPADQLFLDSVREDALADEHLRQAAAANTIDNFKYVFSKALEGLFIDRMEQNEDIFNRFMSDEQFQQLVEETLRLEVYEQIKQDQVESRSAKEADNQADSGPNIASE